MDIRCTEKELHVFQVIAQAAAELGAPCYLIGGFVRDRLIGRNGALLEDIQLLLNRVLLAKDKHAAKVQVDIEHWREMKDDGLAQRVRQIADIVRHSGRPYHLEPMNAYERRIVHNAFKDDPEIATWSPPDDARLKRITLRKRQPGAPEQ